MAGACFGAEGVLVSTPPASTPTPRNLRRLIAVGAAVVVLHNVLVGAGLGEAAMLVANVLVAAGLVLGARRAGLDPAMVGLHLRHRSLVTAATIVASAAAVVLLAAASGLVQPDPVLARLTTAEWWFRVLVAIPVGTAAAEEVMFRGVLLAAADGLIRRRTATAAISVLFGLWHIAAEAQRTGSPGLAVVPGLIATTAASALVLAPLRRRTGDLTAPVALHAAINVGVFTLVTWAAPATT